MSKLPVHYFSQSNAWMTGEILDSVLTRLNRLSSCSRSIILLMDNAGCHPHNLKANIRIVFLPPNTTSQIQPLDLGIIQNFKINYRKLLLRFVLSKNDESIDKGREGLETENLSALWVTSLWRIGAMQAGAHTTVTLCTCSLHKKCPRDFRFGE